MQQNVVKCYIMPAGMYMSKVNKRNTRTRCEICSKLIIKTKERRHWHIGVVLVSLLLTLKRSSRQEVFYEKGVLRKFAKHRKTPVRVSFLIKLQASGLRPAALLKKRLWHRCFPVNFVKFLGTPIPTEHLWSLLLFEYISHLVLVFLLLNLNMLLPAGHMDIFFRLFARLKEKN